MEPKMTDILINNAYGSDDVAKASIPFIVGCASADRPGKTAMFLTHASIFLVTDGGTDGMQAEGMPPLEKLVQAFIEKGGLVWVCKACADAKGMSGDDLIDGAVIAGAGNILNLVENGGQVLM